MENRDIENVLIDALLQKENMIIYGDLKTMLNIMNERQGYQPLGQQ